MNTIHCMDCLEGLRTLASGSARLIFADPPYNLSGATHRTVQSGKRVVCDKGQWDQIKDVHKFNEQWIEACLRALADDGTLWISGTLHNHPSVGMALKQLNCWIINDVIWFKRNAPPLLSANRLAPSTELIWVASKSKRYYFNYPLAKEINGGKQMRNLWEISAARHVTSHPTEKPVALLERIINIASEPGDLVVDPFTGSGTTAVVAHALGRNFTGFELDENYAAMARKRVADIHIDSSVNQPAPQQTHDSAAAQIHLLD
ncbi:MAG: site-specific DNA-methyltransferase [Gammaproteobacteria bacterium]|nr:site-specific DNA-methyltransferase [Gammaproteobacteria bacterium]